MFKQRLAVALSVILAFSSFAYAEDVESVIEDEPTVIEYPVEPEILSEEKESEFSQTDAESEAEAVTEDENTAEIIMSTSKSVPEENTDIQILTETVVLMGSEPGNPGNIITSDTYTDDMSNNDGKFECVNFSSYADFSPSEIANFDDKTILSFTAANKEAYVTYAVAGTRVFTNITAVGYTRDGGRNAVVQYSTDGITYTDVDSAIISWKKVGAGGSGQNDAGWSDKNRIEVSFGADEGIKYIRVYKAPESRQGKFKLGDITLTSTDPYALKPDPEIPENYGAEIDTDSITDDLDTTDYLFDSVNFKSYTETNPDNAALFTDSSLMSFAETGKEAYFIYKAADGRVFTEVKVENYTRDGGVNAEIYVSSDGWTYTNLNAEWKHVGAGGSGANDAGWSDKNITEKTISTEKNIRFVKVRKAPESARTKWKIGKVDLATADVSKGAVIGDVYEEQFDEELYHVNSSKGITVADGTFKADAGAELVYKSMIKKALAKITVTVENTSDWSGIVEAMDVNGNKINKSIEIQKDVEAGNTVVTAELPSSAAYVKIVNASACTYSGITVESDYAQGTEWTTVQKGTGSAFSISLDGSESESLQDGCTVSVNIPVKNAGSIKQDVKAVICVFEGDMMEKMEVVDVTVGGGELVNAEGSIEVAAVTENTYVTVFVWSDLQTMIPFGTEMYLNKN